MPRKKKSNTEDTKKKAKSDGSLDAFIKSAEHRLGKGAVQKAKDSDCLYLLRRPCGIFSLDLATSGGMPAGSMVEFTGPESVGKNYLANRYMAECQRIYGDEFKAFVAVTEYKMDKFFARQCGLRIAFSDDEIAQIEEASGGTFSKDEKAIFKDQVGEIVLAQNLSPEEVLQVVIDALKSGAFHIGVLDSIGNLSTTGEIEKDFDKAARMADRASLQTRFMNKFYYAIARTNTLLIVLNQVRMDMDAGPRRSYIGQFRNPDACAVKHGLSANLFMVPGGALLETSDGKEKRRHDLGKYIRWQIMKGKAGFHEGATGEWKYYFNTGVDTLHDFIDTAVAYADQSGAYYSFMDQRFHGRQEFMNYFTENPDRIEEAKAYIYKKKGIVYKWQD